jgi:hypothetical protein
MIKIALLLRKKAGTTREQFIDYYENKHVPLIMELTGKYIVEYKRNFICWDDPLSAMSAAHYVGADGQPSFDVITEIWVRNRETMMAMFARAQEPEIADIIARDEENCFDRAASRMMIVEEHPL